MAAILSQAVAGVGFADSQLRVAGGSAGGSYDTYAHRLGELLDERSVEVLETNGSGENIEKLVSGDADIAFAQLDVYADKVVGDPDKYHQLEVVGKVSDECVYMAVAKNGPVRNFGDLAHNRLERPLRVALGDESSGTRGTWRYLVFLLPALDEISIGTDSGAIAINRLDLGGYDAVGWVTDPDNLDHASLKAALANEDLQLISVDDSALVSALPNGVKVYESKKVKVEGGWFGKKFKTVCTSGILLARPDLSSATIDQIATLLASDSLRSARGD